MKTRFILSALAVLAIAAFGSPVFAQVDPAGGFGYMVGGFLDEDGDGFNDLAPDADGDGIPNGLDPDYAPVCDGTGDGLGLQERSGASNQDGFIYRQGYNYNHRTGTTGFGPGDGTGNDGEGPGDGSGFGPGDGTGEGGGFGPGDGTCTPQLDGNGLAGRN